MHVSWVKFNSTFVPNDLLYFISLADSLNLWTFPFDNKGIKEISVCVSGWHGCVTPMKQILRSKCKRVSKLDSYNMPKISTFSNSLVLAGISILSQLHTWNQACIHMHTWLIIKLIVDVWKVTQFQLSAMITRHHFILFFLTHSSENVCILNFPSYILPDFVSCVETTVSKIQNIAK